jgi:hypothetical protein
MIKTTKKGDKIIADNLSQQWQDELDRYGDLYLSLKRAGKLHKVKKAKKGEGNILNYITFQDFVAVIFQSQIRRFKDWAWVDNRLEKNQKILKIF